MSRVSHISDSDHRKLDATVLPDCVVESHQVSDTTRGWRRVQVTKLWRTERVIGHGAFGEVLLQALDNDREKKRALKIIRGVRMTQDEFQRELTAMIEFTKPKYQAAAVFVEFFGWFQNPKNSSMYLAMEYMRGGDLEANLLDLEALIKSGPAIPESEIRDITSQILEGLKIMHGEGFAHRDLKPKNIFVVQRDPRWWVKLGDFGLAKKQTDETVFRTQAGTEKYMAPERYYYVPGLNEETSEYTNAVDIWALGCIVFRILTRAVPFPSLLALRKYANRKEDLSFKVSGPTSKAEGFVRNLLAPHPADRPSANTALEHTWIMTDTETNSTHAHTTLWPTSEIDMESQGGFSSATHPGLQSYGLPPEAIHVPQNSSHQEAESELLAESTPDMNSIQRPLSRSGHSRSLGGSRTSSPEDIPTRTNSRSEGNKNYNYIKPMIERGTDDTTKTQERQMVLLVAADNEGKASSNPSLSDSIGDADGKLSSYLGRHETQDEDIDRNDKTKKSRTEKQMDMEIETTDKIFVASDSNTGDEGRVLRNQHEERVLRDQDRGKEEDEGKNGVAIILPLQADLSRQAEMSGSSNWPKHSDQTSTRSYTAQGDITQTEMAIQLLLENGFDANQDDFNKENALYWAASHGKAAVLQFLLDNGADIEAKNVNGWTALHIASRFGHKTSTELLVEKGAEIEAQDRAGWTALYLAARWGHTTTTELLLEKGAEIEAQDKDEWTALHLAARGGYKTTIELLLKKGLEIETQDKNGWTALHHAAKLGHTTTIELLLKKEAEIEAQDKNGWTALHHAARLGHTTTIELLLEKGAEMEARARDKYGLTALHLAASKGYKTTTELLLEKGANIKAKDVDKWTALHLAARGGHKTIVELLLEKGAEIEARSKNGQTALHHAASTGQKTIVELLLEKGANIKAKNRSGGTALTLAAMNGHKDISELLRKSQRSSFQLFGVFRSKPRKTEVIKDSNVQ